LLVLPFRLVTAGLFPALRPNFSVRAMPGTRHDHRHSRWLD
jgi:hypothetical protein